MTYKHDYDKHDYYKNAFKFKGDQKVDQANDANVDQNASVEQVALVDQELNQAVIQNNDQNNTVLVESGDGGAGGAGGGGDGADLDLDVIEAILGSGLPPGIIRGILDDLILIGDDGGAGGAGGAGGDIGDVTAVNVNNQTGFNIGANFSDVDQDLDADFDQDQDVGIGQVNLASLDVF